MPKKQNSSVDMSANSGNKGYASGYMSSAKLPSGVSVGVHSNRTGGADIRVSIKNGFSSEPLFKGIPKLIMPDGKPYNIDTHGLLNGSTEARPNKVNKKLYSKYKEVYKKYNEQLGVTGYDKLPVGYTASGDFQPDQHLDIYNKFVIDDPSNMDIDEGYGSDFDSDLDDIVDKKEPQKKNHKKKIT